MFFSLHVRSRCMLIRRCPYSTHKMAGTSAGIPIHSLLAPTPLMCLCLNCAFYLSSLSPPRTPARTASQLEVRQPKMAVSKSAMYCLRSTACSWVEWTSTPYGCPPAPLPLSCPPHLSAREGLSVLWHVEWNRGLQSCRLVRVHVCTPPCMSLNCAYHGAYCALPFSPSSLPSLPSSSLPFPASPASF